MALELVIDNPKKKTAAPSLQTQLDLLVDDIVEFSDEKGMQFGYADGSWYMYRDGYWRVASQTEREDMDRLLNDLCPNVALVFAQKKQIIENHLRAAKAFMLDTKQFDIDPFVAVRNGTVDLGTRKLVEHSPENRTTRFIDIDYIPGAKAPKWAVMIDDVLSNYDPIPREAIIGFLQEWMGVALFGGSDERTPRALRKALFLYGPPNAGKSTIFTVVRKLLGTDRIVASRPGDVNNRFGLEGFLTASAWITEEVDSLRKEMDTSRIKCLITGEPVTAQRKGRTDAVLRFKGPVGWAGNTAPNFPESSGAIYERIVTVEVARVFTEQEANEKFGNLSVIDWLEKEGELPGIFNWALEGYFRLLARGRFERIEVLQSVTENIREQNDATYAFLRECCEKNDNVRNTGEVLAWAAQAFAKSTRNEWPKIQTLKMQLRNAVPELYRITPVRARTDSGRVVSYPGLGLNERGLVMWKQAQLDNEAAKDRSLSANEAPLLP